MNVIDNYIIENELYFKKLEYNKSSKFVEIKVPNTELKFKFDENHIKKLENHELLAEIKTLKHYKHYGFSYKNYAEFFVVDKNVFNVIYGDESNLNIDLKFNIGKYIIAAC
jgi:hypothetical protein